MLKKAVFLNHEQSRIDRVYVPALKQRLGKQVDLLDGTVNRLNLYSLEKELAEVEVIFSTWGMVDLSEEEINRYLPQLQAVFYAAGSVQHFARPFLNRGITVVSGWGANAIPVAEFTLSQILLSNKGFHQSMSRMRKYDRRAGSIFHHTFSGNYDVKVGILGAGMIGRKVIELLKLHKVEVMVFDPFLTKESAREMQVTKGTLEEVFSQCQTISNHIANLPETIGILNYNHFSLI